MNTSKKDKMLIGILTILAGLFISFCLVKYSKAAISDIEIRTLYTEIGETQNITQRSKTNNLGTYDYVMVGSAGMHSTQNVHLSFGFEISMLKEDEELENSYVYPWDGTYSKYNNQSSNWKTMYINSDADPHYYNSATTRTSFVVNRFLASSDNTKFGTGKGISEGTILNNGVIYDVWVIGEDIVHQGIKQTGNTTWLSNYEAWLNDSETIRFSFGWDNVRAGTYNNNYKDMYTSIIFNKDIMDSNVWTTKSPHKAADLYHSAVEIFTPESPYPSNQVTRCNNRFNYRRETSQCGYAYDSGVSGQSETGWDTYNSEAYLRREYKGAALVWNTYANDKTFGSMSKSYFKQYFSSQAVQKPEEAEDLTVDTNKIVLTKNEGSTSNIQIGTNVGQTVSGNLYSAPEIYTYNVDDVTEDGSPTFEIGDAIPASESYRNYIDEDQWYGSVEIEKVDYTQKFKGRVQASSTYTWTTDHYEWIDIDGDGEDEHVKTGIDHHKITKSEMFYPTFNWNSSKYDMAFYRISDLQLYELESSYTLNNSTGTANYDALGVHVPFNVRIDGKTSTDTSREILAYSKSYTKASEWMANTSYLAYSDLGNNAQNKVYSTNEASTGKTINLGHEPGHIPTGVDDGASSRAQSFYNKLCNQAGLFDKHNDILDIAGYLYLTDDESNYKLGLAEQCKKALGSTYEMNETASQYEKVVANSVRDIATSIRNGKYYTDLSATYHKIVTATDLKELYVSDISQQNKAAIINDEQYLKNEPVVVFSPVMSPISINGDGETQLVNKIGESATVDPSTGRRTSYNVSQMRLDGTYRIKFDWDNYFQQRGYGDPAGYTKYINQKYISFPFSVYINGKYYEPDSSSSGYGEGYTQWIAVGPTTTAVDIYIPTWAIEGLYGANLVGVDQTKFYKAINRAIEVRVEANNVPEELVLNGEVTYNTNARTDAHYVAIYELPVQISGWIYEFEIDSVYDATNFAPVNWEDVNGLGIYNFVTESLSTNKVEAEKRVGTYNRLGSSIGINNYSLEQRANVRYTADGTMTNDWSWNNTLSMATSKSNYSANAGYLVRGNTIAFTIKTIANLSGDNDSLDIAPTYRYYSEAGVENADVDIWYTDNDGTLIKMGSTVDLENTHTISLGNAPDCVFYENAYYDYYYDTIKQTAYYVNHDEDATEEVKASSDSCYSVGNIHLSSRLRLISGNEEELSDNLTRVTTPATTYRYAEGGSLTDNSGKWNITKDQYGYIPGDAYNANYSAPNYNFKNSMQTWYGQYQIPSTILVCPKNAVEEYIKNGGEFIDTTEDFWLDDGNLVLNFDIKSLQNGNDHLQYYSDTSAGMWGNEKGDDLPSNPTIPDKPGDITIVPIKKSSVKQHFDIGILYLN